MPEYSYKCRTCDHEFTVRKSISEASRDEPCPECEGETRKVWSVPGVAGIGGAQLGRCAPAGTGGG